MEGFLGAASVLGPWGSVVLYIFLGVKESIRVCRRGVVGLVRARRGSCALAREERAAIFRTACSEWLAWHALARLVAGSV